MSVERSVPERSGKTKETYLRANDLLFINEYLKNGRNGRQAWLTIHPHSRIDNADVQASRRLSKVKVQEEIARRIKYQAGITKEALESNLLWCADAALKACDYEALSSITMDCAKLAGLLVVKQEVTTIPQQQREELRKLVVESLIPTNQ